MISKNFSKISAEIPENVCLVAVSKTQANALILEAYDIGQRHFGENKVQDLCDKVVILPKDIHWHMIGHLQTNKVKYIAGFVHLIHTVDSLKLLLEINKQAQKHKRVISCLLQFHIAEEENKFGLNREEAELILSSESYMQLKNIEIIGVMGMASFVQNTSQIKSEFGNLRSIFQQLKDKYFHSQNSFKEISMGMSGDFQVAIQEGSTMVRIGSSLFSSI
jgi:PLP dependent protein